MLSLDLNCRRLVKSRAKACSEILPSFHIQRKCQALTVCQALQKTEWGHCGPWSHGSPAHSGSSGTHLPFGQQRGVLEHVHDDDKELIHPLSHFQATNLQNQKTMAEG